MFFFFLKLYLYIVADSWSACVCTGRFVCTFVCWFVSVCIDIGTPASVNTQVSLHRFVCVHTCISAFVCVSTYVYSVSAWSHKNALHLCVCLLLCNLYLCLHVLDVYVSVCTQLVYLRLCTYTHACILANHLFRQTVSELVNQLASQLFR